MSRIVDFSPYVMPLLHRLDPETAHELALLALATGIVPRAPQLDDPLLATTLFGKQLAHPIGLAAGFDKNARVFSRMYDQGFSFVEVGGVTPLPQRGNPRPRVFRLPREGAVINRMGFPNDGAMRVEQRLRTAPRERGMLGINLASNAEATDPTADFVALVRRFAPYAAYLTLDVSCPNTANGQVFLEPTRLRELLAAVAAAMPSASRTAIVAKLSPDIEDARLETLVEVLIDARIDAIAIANTTVQRPALASPHAGERGGLSGRPLFAPSTALLARVHALTRGTIPLIGIGGISSGADAYAKIRAGASALQLYTAMIYAGPALVARIGNDLAALMRRDGVRTIAEAVGMESSVRHER
jgi:dihydroorotate dehydrogenase